MPSPGFSFSGSLKTLITRPLSGWKAYLTCLLVMGALFTLSQLLVGESEALFSTFYLCAAVFLALGTCRGPANFAALLAALSIDYHYLQPEGSVFRTWESFALLATTFALVELMVALVVLLKRELELTELERKRASSAALSREQILSLVAHDLRQPLAAAGMRSALLRRALEKGDFAKSAPKHLDGLNQDFQRVDRMIDDLLDLGKIDSNQLQVSIRPFDAVHMAKTLLEDFQLAHPSVTVRLSAPDACSVLGDAQRYQQALGNLLSNAVKYGDKSRGVQVELRANGSAAETTVTNFGPGLSEKQIPHLFDRFVRAESARLSGAKGLGLGLFITKSLVSAQGGTIWVKSTPAGPTVFGFTLPLDQAGKRGSDSTRTSRPSQRRGEARPVL
jgi:signal transduction histidine kinase